MSGSITPRSLSLFIALSSIIYTANSLSNKSCLIFSDFSAVWQINPQKGSVGGGTWITIYGEGFDTDPYVGSNAVYFLNQYATIPCIVITYLSTSSTLVCEIASPNDPELYEIPFTAAVVVNGTNSATCTNSVSCQFTYSMTNTPVIKAISPTSGPTGTVVVLAVSNFHFDDYVTRVMIGDVACNTMDENGERSVVAYNYNLQLDAFSCTIENVLPGNNMVNILVPSLGNSIVAPEAVQLDINDQPFVFQVLQGISEISPRILNPFGGNELLIDGSGFTDSVDLSVSVGDSECTITETTPTSIKCLTQAKTTDADIYMGGSGIWRQLWRGQLSIEGVRALAENFISPNETAQLTSFEELDDSTNYGDYYRGYFVAPQTSVYTFLLSGDDNSQLWLSNDENPENKQLIAYIDGWSNLHEFTKQSTQISEPMELEARKAYYIEALHVQGGGGGHLSVSVKLDNTNLTEGISATVVNEVQDIWMWVEDKSEIQTIIYASNVSGISTTLSFGDRTVDFSIDYSNVEARDAIIELLGKKCEYPDDEYILFYDLDTFEPTTSNFYGGIWNQDIVPLSLDLKNSFCGRYSMFQPRALSYNFNFQQSENPLIPSQGFLTQQYPYLCTAYKLPENTTANMVINLENIGYRSVVFNMFPETWDFAPVASWSPIGSTPITADNEWHYTCINLDQQLEASLGSDSYRVIGMAWYSPNWDREGVDGSLWIDEFSISSDERTVYQVAKGALDNQGLYVSTVDVTKSTEGMSTYWQISMNSVECGHNFPSLQVGEVPSLSVARTQPASLPLGGNSTLSMNGLTTLPIPANATGIEVQKVLIETFGIDFEVTSANLCDQTHWTVTFLAPGQQPDFVIDGSGLLGTPYVSSSQQLAGGGLYYIPIPNYMLRTIHSEPQVVVSSNGHFGICTNDCSVTYVPEDQLPVISSLSPIEGTQGTLITITGSALSAAGSVLIGGQECIIKSVSAIQVTCEAPAIAAGTYIVDVHVDMIGSASSDKTFASQLIVSQFDPQSSGIFGGQTITVTGKGFGPETTVNTGSIPCEVTEASYDRIICETGLGTVGTFDLEVKVGQTTKKTSGFSFINSGLPKVTTISPATGLCTGGVSIELTGNRFSASSTGNFVEVGGAECVVTSSTSTSIQCIVGKMSKAGSYAVKVLVDEVGYADTTNINFICELEANSVTPSFGSIFGNTEITIVGSGFDAAIEDLSLLSVTFQATGKPCQVSFVNSTHIICTTVSTAITHVVDNNAKNAQYGLGYSWNPETLNVTQGDSIQWFWTASQYTTTLHSVEQSTSELSNFYSGLGFRSEKTRAGSFLQTFNYEGNKEVFYVSGNYATIGMKGSVHVNPIVDISSSLVITIDSVPVTVDSDVSFTFSVGSTPTIQSLTPVLYGPQSILPVFTDISKKYSCSNFPLPASCPDYPFESYPKTWRLVDTQRNYSSLLSISGSGFGSTVESNDLSLWTIDYDEVLIKSGMYKLLGEHSLTTSFCKSTDVTGSKINCELEEIPAGVYSVGLTVDNKGDGFSTFGKELFYVVPHVTSISTKTGSRGGGLLLTINGLHFSSDLSQISVKIGDTPCLPINSSFSQIICETQFVANDGYQVVVKEDRPLVYFRLQDCGITNSAVNSGTLGSQITGSYNGAFSIASGIKSNGVDMAASFTNTGNYVSTPFASQINSNQSFTIEFWYKETVQSTNNYRLIIGSFAPSPTAGFSIWISPCNTIEFWLGTGMNATLSATPCVNISSGSSCSQSRCVGSSTRLRNLEPFNPNSNHWIWSIVSSSTTPSPNVWHHVVASYDAANQTQKLFIDGVLTGNQTLAPNTVYVPNTNPASPLLIGGGYYTVSSNSTGVSNLTAVIDEFAFYNQALPASFISEHYYYGSSSAQPLFVASGNLAASCGFTPCGFSYTLVDTPLITSVDTSTPSSITYQSWETTGITTSQAPVTTGREEELTTGDNDSEDATTGEELTTGEEATTGDPEFEESVKRFKPRVKSVTRSVIGDNVNKTLTIYGNGFNGLVQWNRIELGIQKIDCQIISASDNRVQCYIPALVAGYYDINLYVDNKGRALVESSTTLDPCGIRPTPFAFYQQYGRQFSFFQELSVTNFSPLQGSFGGGTEVTIQGYGFSPVLIENFITFRGVPCAVTSASLNQITCIAGSTISLIPDFKMSVFPFTSIGSPLQPGIQFSVFRHLRTTSLTLPNPFDKSAVPTYNTLIPGIEFKLGTDLFNGTLDFTEGFSGILRGFFKIDAAVNITFFLTTDVDLSELHIDNTLAIQNNNQYQNTYRTPVTMASPILQLSAGFHIFDLTFAKKCCTFSLLLNYQGAGTFFNFYNGINSSNIPQANLFHTEIPIILNPVPVVIQTDQLYDYSIDATPQAFSVTPSSGVAGDSVIIGGKNFGGDFVQVTIGGVECQVTQQRNESITCKIGLNYGGSHEVHIYVSGKGNNPLFNAQSVRFTQEFSIESLSPNSGSYGGGQTVIIVGYGFSNSESSFVPSLDYEFTPDIQICGSICKVNDLRYDQIICTLSPFLNYTNGNISSNYLALPGFSIYLFPNLPDSQLCSVSLRILEEEISTEEDESVSTKFEFSKAQTPLVNLVSPNKGGTAGGTIITITGEGFSSECTDNYVTIDGAECTILSCVENSITCRTSSHTFTRSAPVIVNVGSKGASVPLGEAIFNYQDMWSSPFTWGGQNPPAEGESVYIGPGQTVILNVSPPPLNLILIEGGSLIFDDSQDIALSASYIFVDKGGLFQVGTEEQPFTHNAIITLHGNISAPEIPIYGAKVLALRSGTLDLHGVDHGITWTNLEQSGQVGDDTLHLMEPVEWQVGDELVISPSNFNPAESERVFIVSVSEDGTQIQISPSLSYCHPSYQYELNNQTISLRTQVGRLTRNVKIVGTTYEPGAVTTMYGATVMIHSPMDGQALGRFENIEVANAGQAFRLGRYPIHFHMTGSVTGSYIRRCSIHDTFNRAVTIHGIHYLHVEENIVHNTMGHSIFLEDGVETNNVIHKNLVIGTKASMSLLNTDQNPASFWITNPSNTWTENVAAGSTHHGFWFNLNDKPTGPSYNWWTCPNQMELIEFDSNVAHSNGHFGLWIWPGYHPHDSDFGCSGNPQQALFSNFTGFRNLKGMEFMEVGSLKFDSFVMADNVNVGVEVFAPIIQQWGDNMVSNGVIDGSSSQSLQGRNLETSRNSPVDLGFEESCLVSERQISEVKVEELILSVGLMTPNGYGLVVSNVTFANFYGNRSALGACSHCMEFQGGFETRFEGLSFINVENKVAFPWEHAAVFRDLDGSLSGNNGSIVVPYSETYSYEDDCELLPEYSSGVVPGVSCRTSVSRAFMTSIVPGSLTWTNLTVSTDNGASTLQYKKHTGGVFGYMFLAVVNDVSNIQWDFDFNQTPDPTAYWLQVTGLREDEDLWISQIYHTRPDHWSINGVVNTTEGIPGSESDTGEYYFNETDSRLTYIVSGGIEDQWVRYELNICPVGGCIIKPPPVVNQTEFRWSNASTWNGVFPREGDDVIVPPEWKLILDISPPALRNLTIFGSLVFEDSKDLTLSATYILVTGQIIVGTKEEPFTHNALIQLTGTRDTPSWPLTSELVLGSKAIGIFGNLSAHGIPRNVSWTSLSGNANAGSNTITLRDQIDWQIGDQIVISSTDFNPNNVDIAFIQSINSENEIVLDRPLLFTHSGSPATEISILSAEVGLLTRNIVIEGFDDGNVTESESYGCRIVAGTIYDYENYYLYEGMIDLSNVEIRNCGQRGFTSVTDPRFSIAFMNTKSESSIQNCAIHDNFNTAIGLFNSENVHVVDNVIYDTIGQSIIIDGEFNSLIHNLVVRSQIFMESDTKTVYGAIEIKSGKCIVQNNVVAGAERAGWIVSYADPCESTSEDQISWFGNAVHSTLHGIHMRSGMRKCTLFNGWRIFKNWDYGIFTHVTSSIIVRNSIFVDNHVSVTLNVIGSSSLAHILSNETVTIENTVFIGQSPSEDCFEEEVPPHAFCVSFEKDQPYTAIMMSSFTEKLGKEPCSHLWEFMETYPAINGAVFVHNVTFSNFNVDKCGKRNYVMSNNKESPDATHPNYFSSIHFDNVDNLSKVKMFAPNTAWINPIDCIDMDCDGPKHGIIRDLDGSFLENSVGGSVIPQAEIRFDDSKLPITFLTTPDGEPIEVEQAVQERGIYRSNCNWVFEWNAYACDGADHQMLVIESLDADTETRRLSPIALSTNGTTDLINGPMDHGWCTQYTCLKRLSTFFTVVHTGMNYSIYFSSTAPQNLRLHLLNTNDYQSVKLSIYYTTPQRLDIYKNSVYIEPNNAEFRSENGGERFVYLPEDDDYVPNVSDFGGANYMQSREKLLHVVIRGSTPITIITAPVVQVSFGMVVTVDEFFETNLINNMAAVLNIDASSIRIVNVVAESKRKDASSVSVDLQIGDPPTKSMTASFVTEVDESGDENSTYVAPPSQLDLMNLQTVQMLTAVTNAFVQMIQSREILNVFPGLDLSSVSLIAAQEPATSSANTTGNSSNFTVIRIPQRLFLNRRLNNVQVGTLLPTFSIEVRDSSNSTIPQLAGNWTITASLVNTTQLSENQTLDSLLQGDISVDVVDGVATFSNIYLADEISSVQLRFSTNVGDLIVSSNTFSATIDAPVTTDISTTGSVAIADGSLSDDSGSNTTIIIAATVTVVLVAALAGVMAGYVIFKRKKAQFEPRRDLQQEIPMKQIGPGKLFTKNRFPPSRNESEAEIEPAIPRVVPKTWKEDSTTLQSFRGTTREVALPEIPEPELIPSTPEVHIENPPILAEAPRFHVPQHLDEKTPERSRTNSLSPLEGGVHVFRTSQPGNKVGILPLDSKSPRNNVPPTVYPFKLE